MTAAARAWAAAVAAAALAGCVRPADDRAELDLEVGRATGHGLTIAVADGLAHVRALEPGLVRLWAQAPVLAIAVDADAPGTWTVIVDNALPDAELTGAPATAVEPRGPRAARRAWEVALPAGTSRLVVAPPDAGDLAPWRFAAMADIQTALPDVDDVFAVIDATPGVRFVVAMGDLTEEGAIWEYDLLEAQLETLDVPFYATIGNHELHGPPSRWRDRFGRLNVHFAFRGVAFSLIDSGSATIDPIVYGWLDDWLDAAADDLHVFLTHYPPLDPVGFRQGSFASRREAAKLLSRLAEGGVDLTLYGHLHTLATFDNAGIPAYISGGGGALPMRLDGIGRHFLVVDVEPAADRIAGVEAVRVP